MAGRNTLLTKALQKKIVKTLKAGATKADTCAYVGIGEATFYEWLERGEAGEAPFAEFAEAVTQALSDAKVVAIDSIRSAMTPYKQSSTTTETYTETKHDRQGQPYEYKRKTERKTVTLLAGDWRAAVEYLKRRFPQEWSEKVTLDIDIKIELVIQTIQALEDAGIDATEFFQKAKASAESRLADG